MRLNSVNSRTEKNIFLFCIYKMYLISAEGYENAEVDFLKIRKADKIWVSMKNVHDGLGFKNMSGLVLKETYGKYGRKKLKKMKLKNIK